MYLGKVVEIADCDELFDSPKHPYTRALLEAVPVPDPAIERGRAHRIITGEVPSPLNPPARLRLSSALRHRGARVPQRRAGVARLRRRAPRRLYRDKLTGTFRSFRPPFAQKGDRHEFETAQCPS